MSTADLLTVEETAQAAAQGWGLHHVYDLDTKLWRVMVLASPSAEAGSQFVVAQAKAGSPLAQKALRLVMAGFAAQPKKGKK